MSTSISTWEEDERRRVAVVYTNRVMAAAQTVAVTLQTIEALTRRLRQERGSLAATQERLERRYRFESSVQGAGYPTELPTLRATLTGHHREIRFLTTAVQDEERRLRDARAQLDRIRAEGARGQPPQERPSCAAATSAGTGPPLTPQHPKLLAVTRAVQQLQAQGERASVRKVHRLVGGSFRDIARLLRALPVEETPLSWA